MQQGQIQQLLQQASAAFSQGNTLQAKQCCSEILAQLPKEANALHLMALVCKKENQPEQAESFFQRAIEATPNNAEAINNYGNLLHQLGREEEALQTYKKAAAARTGYAEPYFNMALIHQATKTHADAVTALEKALAIKPDDPRFTNALGVSFKELDRLDDAVEAYGRALKVSPRHFKALHNMGVVLRMQDKQEEAIRFFELAMAIDPRVAELRYNYANALYELGRHDEADEEYRKAIALKPDYLLAHETLNQMYWEHGKKDLFAKSFEIGIKSAPQSADLYDAYAKSLEMSGQSAEAEALLDRALDTIGKHGGLLRRKARILAAKGDVDASLSCFEEAVLNDENSQPIRMDYSQVLIQVGQYEKALGHLDVAEGLEPFDQEMWSYRGLCWRLLGDKREKWLNDYERFVQPQWIEKPDGYASLDDFMAELRETVTAMHTTQVRPLEQTLRGGTQTHGRLFFRPVPIVQTLRTQLEKCIHRYVDALPEDASHPLLMRKSHSFRFAGSWSVRLAKDGFHVNHVHPDGWISSAFYVDVPTSVQDEDANHEGWIKFGESGLLLGEDREEIKRIIKPEPGMLALFPSYLWHGTVPFTDDGVRMTTPFDVVPL